ncbi:MAG: DUF4349 domain-containing protein [Spirochaetales bacterium]|nr:DUF4349 domain-containing protein [Spirochaetales bacterium]
MAPSEGRALSEDRAGDVEREEAPGVPAAGAARRMLVYDAGLELLVVQLQSSVDQVETIVKSVSGHIEERAVKAAEARLKIRIPVADFRATLEKLEKLGEVLHRSITAEDVTREFQDTSLRLEMLGRVRDRYYALLKAASRPKERLEIVKEINRITEEIDELRERQKFLAARASLATLELKLRTVAVKDPDAALPSPFGWIAAWDPEGPSSRTGCLVVPDTEGFFRSKNEEESGYQLTSPEGVLLRTGRVKNEPRAGLSFWQEALQIELKKRRYPFQEESFAGGWLSRLVLPGFGARKHVLLFVEVQGARIEWISVFFPDEELSKRYEESARRMIKERRKRLWPPACIF